MNNDLGGVDLAAAVGLAGNGNDVADFEVSLFGDSATFVNRGRVANNNGLVAGRVVDSQVITANSADRAQQALAEMVATAHHRAA